MYLGIRQKLTDRNYSEENLEQIEKLIEFAKDNLTRGQCAKPISGYAGQPNGCNGVFVLDYCRINGNGNAIPLSWIARIAFANTQPRIVFPQEFLNRDNRDKVDRARGYKNAGGENFAPRCNTDFIENPWEYLDRWRVDRHDQ